MRLLAPAFVIAVLPLGACGLHGDSGSGATASGTGTSRSFAVAGFTGVALLGSDDVDVRVGSGFSVRAEGPSAELDKLRITRDGDMLRVGRINSTGFTWGGDHEKVTVYVTMPKIVAAKTAGSGDIRIDRVEGQSFAGTIAGSGNLDLAALTASEAKLSIAGSGDLSAKGRVGSLDANVAGSGDLKARELVAAKADVAVQGSGNIAATVNGPATVSVVGSGDIDLGPGAKCTTATKVGSGTVRCG